MKDYRFVGEPLPGPGAELRRWADAAGGRGWALVYADPWTRHPLLVEGVAEVRGFLDSPGADAILPLFAFDGGVLRYPDDGVLLVELLDEPRGARAGLELFAAGCRALAEALDASDPAGIPSHGALSPWRLVLHADGSVRLLGHGVPPVDALAWLDEETETVDPRGLRYFPPERLEDRGEDARSDLFGLVLCAGELITGKPILDGALNGVLDTIYDGKVADRLEAALGDLAEDAVELLCSGAEHRLGDRPKDLRALAEEADGLAAKASGTSLADCIAELPQPDAGFDEDAPTDAPNHGPEPTEMLGFPSRELPPEAMKPVEAPEVMATEVVDLSHFLGAEREADTLLAAQGITPPPPIVEPEPTELAPMSTDEAGLPPELPELPDSAGLPQVRSHATQCVTRAELLAALARRAADSLRSAAGVTEAQRVEADGEAEKARKAASTARSSAGLLELDDDVAGARITLDLVTRAEQQAEVATLRVQTLAADVVRRGRAARAALEAQSRAEGEAERHAEAAAAAAESADAAARALDVEREQGQLADPEALGELGRAWEACERADEAAAEADSALAALRAGEGHTTTLERARRAQQTAEEALEAARDAVALARQLERKGAAQVADDAKSEAERAADASRSAATAASRATESAGLVPGDQQASAAADEAREHATTAKAAEAEANKASARAQASDHSTETRAALALAREAADRAAAAAVSAREAAEAVARRAGAAAEQAARLASLREEAGSEVDTLRRLLERNREEVAEAKEELAPVSAAAAHQAVARAKDELDDVGLALDALRKRAAAVQDAAGVEAIRAEVEKARDEMRTATLLAAARRAASDELEAIEAERTRTASLTSAREEAAAHAATCKKRVAEASDGLKKRIRALRAHGISAVDERCTRAQEILEIAAFQAGEATQSAQWANGESDPAEAAAHAETAASFAERITLDLPEAHALVEEAEAIAAEMRATVEAAHAAARALRAEAEGAPKALAAAVAAALEASRTLATTAVDRTRELLEEALRDVASASRDAVEACDAALEATEPEPAQAQLELAREASGRLTGLEANARDRRDALERIAASTRETLEAIDRDRSRTREWAQAATEARESAEAAATAARAAVERHAAVGDAARDGLSDADGAASEAASASAEAQAAAADAAATEDVEAAADAADRAEQALSRANRAREKAEDGARRAEAAAAEEARERDAARERRLQAAREVAATHAERAQGVADRVAEIQAEVLEELGGVQAPVAKAEADAAAKAVALCAEAASEAQEALAAASAATDDALAESEARKAQSAAGRAQQIAAKAEGAFQRARDHARAAAKEADALAQVAEEAVQAVGRAERAVARAKEEAREILQLKLGLDAKKRLATTVRDDIQAAERALAKVSATAPMAAEASDLGTAQALLATCRATVARAEERADAIRELVAEAARAVAEEGERRAKALAEARKAARQPAEQARERAAEARGWLESARRNADGVVSAKAHLDALQAQVEQITAIESLANAEADKLDQVDDTGAVSRATGKVSGAVKGLDALVEAARAAHKAVEQAVEEQERRRNEVKSALVEARQIRDHTREVATRARAAVEELEAWIATTDDPGTAAQTALNGTRIAATQAAAAVEAIDTLLDQPPLDPRVIAGTAQRQIEQAIAGLEAVVAGDATCREAVAAHIQSKAEANRAAEDARRKEQEEKERKRAEAKQKKADNREAKRLSRLDDRRRRFLERRGQSDSIPRPIPEAKAPRDPSADPAPQRQVRRWERGRTSATEGSTRPKRRPRPSTRPEAARPEPPAAGSGADALLQRLRERHKRDGDDG